MADSTTLSDKQEITEVCYRYAHAVDSRDWEALAACFTPDADAHYEGLPDCVGYPAIEATCRNALEPLSASQHLIANVVATPNGDTADSVCYFQAQHVRDEAQLIIAGRYRDRLVRTADGWKIAERNLDVMWRQGTPGLLG